MATVITTTRLGPADYGRPLTREEYFSADYEEGYKYELIYGRLYVAPAAGAPEGSLELWLLEKLLAYIRKHPEVINMAYNKVRVHVPGEDTIPEPDLAAYKDFPRASPLAELNWDKLSPVLVAEILSPNDPSKDLIRNVALYLSVPSIKEYWIVDGRKDPDRPHLVVYRRHGERWRKPLEIAYGEIYTTRLLPGFKLIVDPRR